MISKLILRIIRKMSIIFNYVEITSSLFFFFKVHKSVESYAYSSLDLHHFHALKKKMQVNLFKKM